MGLFESVSWAMNVLSPALKGSYVLYMFKKGYKVTI